MLKAPMTYVTQSTRVMALFLVFFLNSARAEGLQNEKLYTLLGL